MKYSKVTMNIPTDEQVENEMKTLPCIVRGCCHEPEFNFFIFGTPLFCRIHSNYDMNRVKDNVCSKKNCQEPAFYGLYFPGTDVALPMACEFHRGRYMQRLFQRPCSVENCGKISTHGFGKIATHCLDHKDGTRMHRVDLHHRCEMPFCLSTGKYNYPRKKIPVRCKIHKTDNMVDVYKLAICEIRNCNKIPRYTYGESMIPRRCEDHKKKKMREIKVALCSAEGCRNFATVRRRNTEESDFTCADHANSNGSDLIHCRGNILLCMHENCDRLATYGNTNRRRYLARCSLHKEDHMSGPFYTKRPKPRKRKRGTPFERCSSFFLDDDINLDVPDEMTDTLLMISKMQKTTDESEKIDITN